MEKGKTYTNNEEKEKSRGLMYPLADMAARTSYEQLAERVIEDSKLHILDSIGGAFVGNKLGVYKPIVDIYKELGGKPESSVILDGYRIPCLNAAFYNSAMMTSANYEDTHRLSVSHPCSAVIPAALAMAEREAADGKALLVSVIIGYEVMTRIGMAMPPSLMTRGFQPVAVLAPFGAAGAAGKILGFNEEAMADALSISANLGSGLVEVHESLQARPVAIAKSTQAGVLSALLAQRGVKGPHSILEGGSVCPNGYLQAHSDTVDLGKVTQNLGEDFEISKTAYKIHYACRYTHAPLDAFLGCVEENHVEVDDIKTVEIRIGSVASNFMIPNPKTGEEAMYNIPFITSIGLTEHSVSHDMFSDDKLQDPEIRRLMDKVKVVRDQSLDEEYKRTGSHYTSIAEITMKDGKVKAHRVDIPKGEPENPASKEELIEKFRKLSAGVIDKDRIEQIISTVEILETLDDSSELMKLIS
jgi:2-methylcitrate dehydratase PrpD